MSITKKPTNTEEDTASPKKKTAAKKPAAKKTAAKKTGETKTAAKKTATHRTAHKTVKTAAPQADVQTQAAPAPQ
ncbi:hypothetical protein, partial [Candidatus Avelusimicrobium faecicola]|uniref:hypothetical protein n=1 Tax=Candidatus Avelusimicrobium faecicola TaxID=3416205 RepID=UPI003D0F0123